MDETIELPNEAPVMPLPGATLFPHALLPLFIFESRYRKMLDHALQHHRMFCVALIDQRAADPSSLQAISRVATVGLVRASVEREDGTSNLILQGLRRVRLGRFIQTSPFRIAEILPLKSVPDNSVVTAALSSKVLELYQGLKESGREFPTSVDEHLSNLSDPEMLADLVTSMFINDPPRRQAVLEELSVSRRLRLVIRYLQDQNTASGI